MKENLNRRKKGVTPRWIASALCCVLICGLIPGGMLASAAEVDESLPQETTLPAEAQSDEGTDPSSEPETTAPAETDEVAEEPTKEPTEETTTPPVMRAPAAPTTQTDDGEWEPDNAFISVQKTFVGIEKDDIPATFKISVGNSECALKDAQKSEDGLSYTWKIEGLSTGTYNIKESGYQIENYDGPDARVTGADGDVASETGATVTVKASEGFIEGVSDPDNGQGSGKTYSLSGGIRMINFNRLNVIAVISKRPLTASERAAVESIPLSGTWKGKFQYYSMEDLEIGKVYTISVGSEESKFELINENTVGVVSASSSWNQTVGVTVNYTAAQNGDITITNTYTKKVTDLTIEKKFEGLSESLQPQEITVNVTGPDKYSETITLTKENNYSYTIEGLIPDKTYTVEEVLNSAQVPNYKFETVYSHDGGSITLQTEKDANKVTITNTYERSVTDLTISKNVTGNMGDRNKDFTFTFKVGQDGEEDTFDLRHNGTKKLTDLTIGETLYIMEEHGSYTPTVTYTVGENTTTVTANEDGWYAIPIAEDTTVTVENNYNVTIDTGIFLDSAPYVLLLGVVAAGAVLLRKRRYSDD